MKIYEPVKGSGWEEGRSMFPDTNRRWRLMLGPGEWLSVTTTRGRFPQFCMSRVVNDREHSLPTPGDLKRVQEDFGVYGWRDVFPMPSVHPNATGMCLLLTAVEEPS